MQRLNSKVAMLVLAFGTFASPAEAQSVRPRPGGSASSDVEYCRTQAFKSIGDCMGYLYSAPPSDRQELCRSIQKYQPGVFDTMGDCIEYIESLQDRFERP